MNDALIIFVRKPELGKVKTRLAATIGPAKALTVYKELLQHSFAIAADSRADKFIYYYDSIAENDIWDAAGFTKRNQCAGNLGDKMKNAFSDVFSLGYKKVMIIGSDCFELTTDIIMDGLARLDTTDVVIGPANDGGYYLLGLKKMLPYLFENKAWSTSQVYDETIADLKKKKNSFFALKNLTDVDTEEDWLKTKR